MGRTQEPGGDYGYDPPTGADAGPVPPAPTGGKPSSDLSGDYAYDEAHDF
jgi:hypothetical protein